MSDLSTWITAIASAVSAWAAYAMWRVSRSLYHLQASVEEARKPLVHIWVNNVIFGSEQKETASVSLINIGRTPLPIRTLRLLGQDGQAMQFMLSDKFCGWSTAQLKNEITVFDFSAMSQTETDLVLLPNIIHQAFFQNRFSQIKVEVMYYDNSFEFIEIDTSNLGGKYILTGQGRK